MVKGYKVYSQSLRLYAVSRTANLEHKYSGANPGKGSLPRSRFFGCHATLPQKKVLG